MSDANNFTNSIHAIIFAISSFLAFIIGSIPTAYLAGRIFKGIDIRQHGSGNVGATNALRVMGKKIGALVFFLDFIKGFLPAFLLSKFVTGLTLDPREAGLWLGIAAILGHVFTPFLGFKGGKGIATGAGVLLGSFPALFLIVTGVWIAVFLFTRIVSVSSLGAMLSLVAFSLFFKLDLSVTIAFTMICLLTIWTHRSNIIRMINGKESRMY